MIEHTRNLVEPAGAAPLAAALKLRDSSRRQARSLVPGGNISLTQLEQPFAILNDAGRRPAPRRSQPR